MSINRVFISGNLTRDPELRSTASGMAVLGFEFGGYWFSVKGGE